MKIAIIGAGGIGCYYAARLINAGEDVTLIARGAHLQAMQNDKLTVAHPDFHFEQNVTALDLDSWFTKNSPDEIDLIIVCIKGMHTQQFSQELSAWFENKPIRDEQKKPFILSLQNGVDNERFLKEALPDQHILGGIARRIGAHIIQPGVVESVGPAQVILGYWPNHQSVSENCLNRMSELSALLNQAEIPTEVANDINKELWRKLIINSGVNPLCALLQVKTGLVTSNTILQKIIRGAMDEAALAATVDDVELSKKDVDEMFELISTFDSIKPSMLVDREKGRELEIEEIAGVVIKACEKLGHDAPYNRCISSLLTFDLQQD